MTNPPIITNDSESHHSIVDESIPEYHLPSEDNFKIGTFILVNEKFGKRGMLIYVYVVVINYI